MQTRSSTNNDPKSIPPFICECILVLAFSSDFVRRMCKLQMPIQEHGFFISLQAMALISNFYQYAWLLSCDFDADC
uniref:Uncharacterized protein n=1 Tax=Solanum lycopersicum TaxID=4081 RepID=A0A3Q7FEN7_SOLLC